MKYHGVEFTDENQTKGVFKLGLVNLLSRIYSNFAFSFGSKKPVWNDKWIDRMYFGGVQKLLDTVWKFDTVAGYLWDSVNIALTNKDSTNMDEFGYFSKAMRDIPIYLDSLLLYFRIEADCLANSLPHLYGTKGKEASIPRNSFRKHINWFTKKVSEFDPEYTVILNNNSSWFNEIAGSQKGQGLRDIQTHYRGTYQLGWKTYKDLDLSTFNAGFINESGFIDENIIPVLASIKSDYFEYLEYTYIHFRNHLSDKISDEVLGDPDQSSVFYKFSSGMRSSWIYPKVTT